MRRWAKGSARLTCTTCAFEMISQYDRTSNAAGATSGALVPIFKENLKKNKGV